MEAMVLLLPVVTTVDLGAVALGPLVPEVAEAILAAVLEITPAPPTTAAGAVEVLSTAVQTQPCNREFKVEMGR
jgi:hypothetical protein